MKLRRYKLYALTTIALLTPPIVWSATEGADNRSGIANSHASLKAYPSAVVSLKDPKSGNLYYVESNGRRLVAFDKNGDVAWNVDVIGSLPNSPLVGQPVIRHLKLDQEHLAVTVAKHAFVEVQTRTGKIKYLGAD